MQTSKKIAVITISALALSTGAAVAGNAATKTTVKKTVVRTSITKPAGMNGRGGMLGGPQATLSTALKNLVAKGTITQAQADAIKTALDAAEAAEHANMPAGAPGKGFGVQFDKQAVILSTLGIDATALNTALQSGKSLADIAGTKKDALIAALVAAETKAIDAAVTAGTLTAANAATMKANLTAHVTAEVSQVGGQGGMGMGGKGRGRH